MKLFVQIAFVSMLAVANLIGSILSQQDVSNPSGESIEKLIRRSEDENGPFWAGENSAKLVYRGEAKTVSAWLAGKQLPLNRVGDSDVWFGSRELDGLAKGILTYSFVVTDSDGKTTLVRNAKFNWRGPDSPASVNLAKGLTGELKEFELSSKHIDAPRKVSVYFPPGEEDGARVIYLADGSSASMYAQVLEPLIVARKILPVVIVGVHNGGYLGERKPDFSDYDFEKDMRAAEYLPELGSAHFSKHEKFFCKEVIDWAEKTLGVSDKREHRLVMGHSNGGRFAVTMGVNHPEVYGHVIGLSVAAGSTPEFDKPPEIKATYYLAAGTWEEKFHTHTSDFDQKLKQSGFQSTFSSRVSGHDETMWQEEFATAIQDIFAQK